MTIAVVTTSFPSFEGDPAGHFVENEARELAAAGTSVVVIAPGDAPSRSIDGVRVIRLPGGAAFGSPGALERIAERPSRIFGALRFAMLARRTLAQLEPLDRVVAHWMVPCAWPIATVAANVEVVVHGSDLALLEKLPRRLGAGIAKRAFQRAARVRFVSSDLARRARALVGREPPDSVVQPCSIDLGSVASRRDARSELGIDPKHRVVLVVGRLVAGKRPSVAFRAATLVPDALVVAIGDGPLGPSLRRRFPSVRFLGRLPRPRALVWMRAADVLVSGSRSEGAPTSIREARALGLPVVTVDAGDVRQWARTDPGIIVLNP